MPQINGPFLPTTSLFNLSPITQSNLSDELQQLLIQMYQQVNNHALVINQKTHGILSIEAYANGVEVYPAVAGGEFRGVAFTAVDFGALPNAVIKSVPHGITFNADTRIIRVTCWSNDPTTQQSIPIPYVDVQTAGAFDIELYINNTNVNIIPAGNATAFTDTFVFIEYTT